MSATWPCRYALPSRRHCQIQCSVKRGKRQSAKLARENGLRDRSSCSKRIRERKPVIGVLILLLFGSNRQTEERATAQKAFDRDNQIAGRTCFLHVSVGAGALDVGDQRWRLVHSENQD